MATHQRPQSELHIDVDRKYLDTAEEGYRTEECHEAQLALVLFRRAQLQAAVQDTEEWAKSITEVHMIYCRLAKHVLGQSEITEAHLEELIPLTSR